MNESSGIPSLDALLDGGLRLGDNVVWVADRAAAVDPIVDAFMAAAPGPARHICLSRHEHCIRDHPGEVLHPVTAGRDLSPAVLEDVLLSADVAAGSRIVVSSLDDLVTMWGAQATVTLYRRTCPRLFDRGAIACWVAGRDLVGPAVIDGVGRIAQCVFELREDRLRIQKAEGRSSRLRGTVASYSSRDGLPLVSREHTVGRLGEGLRRIRTDRALTQGQLAEIAGVTAAAISQAETGRRGLSLDTIVPMCESLGIGLDDLLGTGRPSGPFLARHDQERRDAGGSVALFEDPELAPRVHRVELDAGGSAPPPIATRGRELVLVGDGLVLVDLGDSTPVLRAGDGLLVTETPVRSFTNLDPRPANLFWIAL